MPRRRTRAAWPFAGNQSRPLPLADQRPKGRQRLTTTPAACELSASASETETAQWLDLTRSAQCLSVDELKKTSTRPSDIIRRTCTRSSGQHSRSAICSTRLSSQAQKPLGSAERAGLDTRMSKHWHCRQCRSDQALTEGLNTRFCRRFDTMRSQQSELAGAFLPTVATGQRSLSARSIPMSLQRDN